MKASRRYAILAVAMLTQPLAARWLPKADSGSVVERLAMNVEIAEDGSSWQETTYAIRVQSEDARASVSLFTIDYHALNDKVEVLEAYTQNGNQRFQVKAESIEDRDKGESKDYDAVRTRSLAYPHVLVGSLVYIHYRVITAKALMPGRWSDNVTIRPGLIIEKFSWRVHSARPLYYRVQNPLGLLRVRRVDANTLTAETVRESPGWVLAEREVYFHPDNFSQIWVSTELRWDKFMADLNASLAKIGAAEIPKRMRPITKLAREEKLPERKMKLLMEMMSAGFRYFGDWRRRDGGIVPRSLEEVETSRYGDCKDLSSLLAAVLRAAGVEAQVALVRRGENPFGEEPDYDLPVLLRFNHAIVRAEVNGRAYWLDPTNPVTALAPYLDIAGRPALVLSPKGAYFDRIPVAKPEDYGHGREFTYEFKGPEQTDVHVDIQFKGMGAFHLANELMITPKGDVLSGALDYFSEGQHVLKYKFNREPHTERSLDDIPISLSYRSGRITYNAGKSQFFTIPDGIFGGALFDTADRESDLRLNDEPFVYTTKRRFIKTRLAQELPPACHIKSSFLDVDRQVLVDGRDVVIDQRIELRRPFVRKSEYADPAFRKLQREVRACIYRAGILVHPD